MGLLDRRRGETKRDWTGWVLEDTEHHEVTVQLGQPLGDLEPARQDALRIAFGEEQFTCFSSDDETIAVGDFSDEQAAEIADTLRAAGFRVEVTLRHSYSAYRPADAESRITYIDTHSIDEMQRVADEMVAAGVPVTKKRR